MTRLLLILAALATPPEPVQHVVRVQATVTPGDRPHPYATWHGDHWLLDGAWIPAEGPPVLGVLQWHTEDSLWLCP